MSKIFFAISRETVMKVAKRHPDIPNEIDRHETLKRVDLMFNGGSEFIPYASISTFKEWEARSMGDWGTGWKMYCKDSEGNVFESVSMNEIGDRVEKQTVEIIAGFI